MEESLGILAKYWEPGRVKTRLASDCGARVAALLHKAFLKCVLSRFSQVADHRVLAFAPAERGPEFGTIAGPAWSIVPQCDGDLGQRMGRLISDVFAAGSVRVVLLGADSPTLPRAFLDRAFELLRSHPVVLGPATDGGYYLLGMAPHAASLEREFRALFRDIPWGTDAVFAETIRRLETGGIPVALLPMWYDVDTRSDLDRLEAELRDARSGTELVVLRAALAMILGGNGP
jgi:rSAM/selenodomain-associated transferase 1